MILSVFTIICLFLQLCLFADFEYMNQEAVATYQEFERKYLIQDDQLISYEGKKYPKIHTTDLLHEELYYVLKDPEQADIIHKAYEKYLLPHLQCEEEKESFSKALLKICYFFGSNEFSPKNSLLSALNEESKRVDYWENLFKGDLDRFISGANKPARPNLPPKENTLDRIKVVILSTTASGGNISVANAIKEFLSHYRNVECIIFDVEELAIDTDPIMLATGVGTFDGVYAKYCQQKDFGLDNYFLSLDLSKRLGKYVPSRLGLKLKEKMRNLKPDLILSTRNYTVDDIALSTLGVPFRLVHCDYELSMILIDVFGKVNPNMIQFWLPTFSPRAFLPLFTEKSKLRHYDFSEKDTLALYNENYSTEKILENVAKITYQPIDVIKAQFKEFHFPVRDEFKCIDDSKVLNTLKQKWGFNLEDVPILITMGQNGVGSLRAIFNEVSEDVCINQLKYVFVCGKNEELKDELEKITQKKNLPIKILGFITHKEMNELMNICPVTISKSGGSFASEAAATSTYLLIAHSHLWEFGNDAFMISNGKGQQYDPEKKMTDQILHCLQKQRNAIHIDNSLKWKSFLLNDLKSLFGHRFTLKLETKK